MPTRSGCCQLAGLWNPLLPNTTFATTTPRAGEVFIGSFPE